jgi:hypothetical protein
MHEWFGTVVSCPDCDAVLIDDRSKVMWMDIGVDE